MNSTWNTVGDVMTRAVVAVGRDADFREVAETLQQCQVSALPVLTGDGRVIGIPCAIVTAGMMFAMERPERRRRAVRRAAQRGPGAVERLVD